MAALVTAACAATDLLLESQQREAAREVDAAFAAGDLEGAQQAIHVFAQQVEAAKARDVATDQQLGRARGLIDTTMERIQAARDERTVTGVEVLVADWIDSKRFGQARSFVLTNLHGSDPSPRVEQRLLGLLKRIETAQIDAIEREVEESLSRGSTRTASGLLGLAIHNSDFSEPGRERLLEIERRLFGTPATPAAVVVTPPAPPAAPPPAVRPPPARPPVALAAAPKVHGLEFVPVKAGSYLVGSPPTEPGRGPDEVETERAEVGRFFVSTTEVTQEAFRRVSPRAWTEYSGGRIPAHSVTFGEAEDFCRRLSAADPEWTYDLPTEIEWEIAARALRPPADGPIAARPGDRDRFLESLEKADLALQKYATFRSNRSVAGPGPVARKLPNPLGLYDVHGNVAEWCRLPPNLGHWRGGTLLERPIRGGSVQSNYERCRAAARGFEQHDKRSPTVGFRIVARER